MATSGSTDFNLTRNQIILDALDLLGVGADGETPSSDLVARCARRLNAMVKAWEAAGTHLWTKTEGQLTSIADRQSYTFGGTAPDFAVRALKILSVRRRESGIDTPLTALSREDYFDLPDKSTASIPTSFYYDPQLTQARLYVWPPMATGNSMTLHFTYARQIEDFDAANNNPDFPQEWLEALTYNLAVRLAPVVGVALRADVAAIAAESLDTARGFDVEPASVMIGVDLGVR